VVRLKNASLFLSSWSEAKDLIPKDIRYKPGKFMIHRRAAEIAEKTPEEWDV